MKQLAAYMLLVLGGKTNPTADDIEALMKTVGAECDKEKATKLCDDLKVPYFFPPPSLSAFFLSFVFSAIVYLF